MAGCSPDAEIRQEEHLVPVSFALPDSKVMINSHWDLVNNTSVFGMFAINKALFNDPDGDLTAPDKMNIRNALCRYVAPTATEPASLKFGYLSENRVLYYPMGSDEAYNFYTYHKWTSSISYADDGSPVDVLQDVSEAETARRRINVLMDVATVNDILYSESEAPYAVDAEGNPIDGFNAAYVRKTGNVPVFRMIHPVAGIRFRIVLHPDSKNTINRADRFRLNSMSFTDSKGTLPVKAALCIVDLDDPQKNGTFVEVLGTSASRAWKTMNNSTGNLNIDLLQDVDGDGVTECVFRPVMVGGEHFIVPQDDHLNFTMIFQHQRVNAAGAVVGNWPAFTRTFTLDPLDFGAAEAGYKAGNVYSYKIVVKYSNTTGNPYDDNIEVSVEADI